MSTSLTPDALRRLVLSGAISPQTAIQASQLGQGGAPVDPMAIFRPQPPSSSLSPGKLTPPMDINNQSVLAVQEPTKGPLSQGVLKQPQPSEVSLTEGNRYSTPLISKGQAKSMLDAINSAVNGVIGNSSNIAKQREEMVRNSIPRPMPIYGGLGLQHFGM